MLMATLPLPTAKHIGVGKYKSLTLIRVFSSLACYKHFRLSRVQNQVKYGITTKVLQYAASRSSVDPVKSVLGLASVEEEVEPKHSYLFRTEFGGRVKALVRDEGSKYLIDIEVSCLPSFSSAKDMVLEWGMYRADSSSLYKLNSRPSESSKTKLRSQGLGTVKEPFMKNALGLHAVRLEFDSSQAPFYLSFILNFSSDGNESDLKIRSHRKTHFCVPVGASPGSPTPLGMSVSEDRYLNFALFSRNAQGVVLCLYDEVSSEPTLELELDSYVNRTGDVWHISVPNNGDYVRYGYRCKGPPLWDDGSRFHMRHVLLDPYAKKLGKFSPDRGERVSLSKCLGLIHKGPRFDWNGDIFPRLPMEKLTVYRLNVEQFTKDASSELSKDVAGTFLGVPEKLQHLKALGINAILLEPIFSFDERKGPYLPYNFFSPMNSYGGSSKEMSAITSMKNMVKTLHAHGIEVLLEVVFTNTAEGGDANSQMISLRGIDNSSYYIVNAEMGSDERNTLKCGNPVVQRMILDSLRHWVTEFHIDGFCFINTSSLAQGPTGDYLSRPPLLEAIAFDPLLSKTKIIADCWSPLDMSCKEIHFPHWKRWAEMNTRFCYDVRNFIRGEGLVRDLATRLCGSGDIFSTSRGPAYSFNFVARNFGLSLVDLVSFSREDLGSELSWNCGEEGPTNNNLVLETRLRQIRNFLFILFVSLGVPVLNMGDELGHSTGGLPSHSSRKPIKWNVLKTGFADQIIQFIAFLTSLRSRRSDIFQRKEFLKVECIEWYGSDRLQPKWDDPTCKFLAVLLKAEYKGKDETILDSLEGNIFMGFNAHNLSESVALPELTEGYAWLCLVDTAKSFPGFFSNVSEAEAFRSTGISDYKIMPNSCVLFEAHEVSSPVSVSSD